VNPYSFSVLVFALCSFLLGAQIYLNRRDEIGFRYFVCSFFYSCWGLGYAFAVTGDLPYFEALANFRISNAAASFIPCAWLHFCLVYTNKRINLIHVALLYFLPALILLRCFTDELVPYLRPSGGFVYYPYPGKLFHLEAGLYFVLVPVAFLILIKQLKTVQNFEKSKFIGFIIVAATGYLGGAFTFLPVYDLQVPQQAVFLLPLYPFGLAYFMSSKGFFDLENLAQAAHKDKLAALGILTASINHEIRAPLFVIRGTVETEMDSSKIKERVISQVDRLTGIVSRLTHFAKKGVEEEAKIEPIDLKEVLADIRPLFQHQLNYQSIEFTQDIPADLPQVMADRRYLEEILFNLILNACQALKDASNPKISVSALSSPRVGVSKAELGRGSSLGSGIAVTIADNGPGIPPDQLKNIFKPFHTTKQEGTGLGLYITKQLVEKCDGRIQVDRGVMVGVIFKIYLKTNRN